MSAETQTVAQRDRCIELYTVARKALKALSDERLNLGEDTRAALYRCRGELECFDTFRMQQPVADQEGGDK